LFGENFKDTVFINAVTGRRYVAIPSLVSGQFRESGKPTPSQDFSGVAIPSLVSGQFREGITDMRYQL
jgi:predicted alternative tryptophan synthase beta-subunit